MNIAHSIFSIIFFIWYMVHCRERIRFKYNSLIYLVQYLILIEEKERKIEQKARTTDRFIMKIIPVFAKFSIQVAAGMIFIGNIAAMDFASLTRQVRICKGIDACLSMLIGLLRINLLNDSE